MMNFLPKKSSSVSQRLDIESIRLIRNLLPLNLADVSELEEGGTLPNIDGYISLLEDDVAKWKFTVQIKHLTYPVEESDAFYDIPASVLGYAQWHRGEVVLFLACDTENGNVFWKCIDDGFLYECSGKDAQMTFRYHFRNDERLCAETVDDTLERWKELYECRMARIKSEDAMLEQWIREQEHAFDHVSEVFYGLDKSHIERKETFDILEWIEAPLEEGHKPVKVLAGKAGTGKSTTLKDLIQVLHRQNIGCLPIKADRWSVQNDTNCVYSAHLLADALAYLSARQKKVVLIIDQIDALSQYMSTDRKSLNLILDTVARLSLDYPSEIRIVISCREYDLKYDAALRSLGRFSTVTIKGLDESDVRYVLTLLDKELPGKVSVKTLELLSVPQYLNIFCMLYFSGRMNSSYENDIELYDELWLYTISDAPDIEIGKVEEFLFMLAALMQKTETLSPVWSSSEAESRLAGHLASKGIIFIDNTKVSFFHQTFYEYVLARYYIRSGKKLTTDLETMFQGLEIRSAVKLILVYKKGHSESAYMEDVEALLFSEKIRLHLKLLALSVISNGDNILNSERAIVKRLVAYDSRLMSYFLSHTSAESWFQTVARIVEPLLYGLSEDSEWYIPIRNSLSLYAAQFPEDVFSMIDMVKDKTARKSIAGFVLQFHNDYSSEKVRSWYFIFKKEHPYWLISCLQDALATNVGFVIKEVRFFLQDSLYARKEATHDSYTLKKFSDNLMERYPREFLPVLVDCFSAVISDSSKSFDSPWGYSVNSVFRHYDMSKAAKAVFSRLEELLRRYAGEPDFIKPVVSRLLNLNSEMAFTLAYATMAACPAIFDEEIREIISQDSALDFGLYGGDFEYSFLKMLRNWFLIQDNDSAEWYQDRLMAFSSYTDLFHSKKSYKDEPLFHHLWWRKWVLISNTVPDDRMTERMRLMKNELMRRFGRACPIKKQERNIVCSSIVSGPIPASAYSRFSMGMWLDSFLKLDEKKNYRKGVFHPVDLREHASSFSKTVACRPKFFRDFVFTIFSRNDVKVIYKVAGLEGLLSGGLEPMELLPLFRTLMSEEFVINDPYRFSSLAKYYIVKDSDFFDEFIPFLINLISIPLTLPSKDDHKSQQEKSLEMLNHAINSPQGQAMKLLVSMNSIVSRRKQVYGLLQKMPGNIHNSLCDEVLYYLYSAEYYEEQLFDKLLPVYLDNAGVEVLFFCPQMVQSYWYFKNHLVSSYMERMLQDVSAHEVLAQIFFYGTTVTAVSALCRSNLERIFSSSDEDTISSMISLAMTHISDMDFSELSESILLRFSDCGSDKVRQAYKDNCSKLPVRCFDLFLKISEKWKTTESRFEYDTLRYLRKCVWLYPAKCYRYIKEHCFLELKESSLYFNDVLELLLEIYRKLKEDGDRSDMEELMDLFDMCIMKDNAKVNMLLEDVG